jgi:hypothetical protein
MKCIDFGTYKAKRDVKDLLTKDRLYFDCYVQIMETRRGDDENSRLLIVTTDDGVSRGINMFYFEPVELFNDTI